MLAGLRVDALDGSWKTFWTPARRPWGACLVVGALVVGSGGGKVHARPSPLSWTSKLSSKPKTRATRLQDLQMTHGMASRKKIFRSSLRPLHLHRIDIGVSHWSRSTRAKGDFRSSLGLYHKRQVMRGGREKCFLKGGAETDSSPTPPSDTCFLIGGIRI
ncbi:hypothetical protein F5882DRAFT_120693 [Hyaloscypha sp. PMI_1271]|nr:hypothetical protein F5882DRAFT_120693 [Hyaloscypha sp. PMI_1271]